MSSERNLWSLLDTAEATGLIRKWIDLPSGAVLHVVERPGIGSPVLCLHGIWDWWGYWRPLANADSKPFGGRPLWMVDLRGHGESSKPETGYALSDYAADIVALMAQYSGESVGSVGHSLGALTALVAAAQVPQRVDLIILEDPPLPLQKGGSDMFRGVYELRQQPLEAVAAEYQIWRPWVNDAQALESALCLKTTVDGVFIATFGPEFAATDVPVPGVMISARSLVIQAGDTLQRALRSGGEESLRATLTNVTLESIDGTSHTVLRDAPAAYLALLGKHYGDAG